MCSGRGEHDVDSVAIPCQDCAGTGLRLRPWAELAAYCGAEWAREALDLFPLVPCYGTHLGHSNSCPRCNVQDFCAGLSRWGQQVQVSAAVAAARAAWERNDRLAVGPSRLVAVAAPLRAIEAAEAWLACPCERHNDACYVHAEEIEAPGWSTIPAYLVYHGSTGEAARSNLANLVAGAATLAGEPATRAAIQSALTAYALERLRG